MLRAIDSNTAFELMVSSNKKHHDQVYFKHSDGSYKKAIDIVWYFGVKCLSNRGIHFASAKFYIEVD